MELKSVRLEIPEGANIILGQSHFIKTVEDLYEALVNTVPQMKFGIAFNEASGPCLTRADGNDEGLKELAIRNATNVGAGHTFVIVMRDGYPINVLGRIKEVPEVCCIFCASANPVEVIVAESEQGRGILGVIDGSSPKGVETDEDATKRRDFLRKIGYKRCMRISNEEQLEDILSAPNQADVEAMGAMQGDLLILGISGKMGPSLARRARRASDAAGVQRRVVGVARFTAPGSREDLERHGIETMAADLLEPGALEALPDIPNVIYMAARKFGSTGAEYATWVMNSYLPGKVAERYKDARIVAFSSGNVYPMSPVVEGGSTEQSPVSPVGEYAMSALGRERMFEHYSRQYGTPVTILRLNYAIDLRYGVLYDIGTKVFERRPIDLGMGNANVIWQGDANSVCLRSFAHAQSPPFVLNLTGPETVSVRWAARRFGAHFGVEPEFTGAESPTALLNNAALCMRLFGYPTVSVDEMIEWISIWIGMGGRSLGKPTKFELRDGKF